jgi:hypothetical protein
MDVDRQGGNLFAGAMPPCQREAGGVRPPVPIDKEESSW